MVGPSSSHTAGACRLGLLARYLLGEVPQRAVVALHGSFAATGIGHATDRALIAGVLGWPPDDERLKDALDLAQTNGLQFEIGALNLGETAHPNSARIELRGQTRAVSMEGASIGGGSVIATQIDGYAAEVRGQLETLILWHHDTPGFLARVVSACACVDLNIATVRTSRRERGENALTTLEFDGDLQADILSVVGRARGVERLAHLPILPGF